MSIQYVVAVKDLAVGSFARPVFVPSLGVAIRSFGDEVKRKAEPGSNQMNEHPEDFELWHLAVFDDEGGAFVEAEGGLSRIARGKDYAEGV